MIGKHLGSLAATASLAFAAAITVGFSPARAADLGGNCCNDLEERVAELEATTARKGNRKVSLTISGQVSKSIMWVGDAALKDASIGDNANSPSRLNFAGSAKINAQWSAGYVIELGIGDDVTVRHNYLWVEGPIGKASLGKTSTATDGISEISLANTNVANLPSTVFGVLVDGGRENTLRYDTPTFAGFVASAAWVQDGIWDMALRWSGEGAGFRLAAGAGYAEDTTTTPWTLRRVSGSASLMHMQTGLFANAVLGEYRIDDLADLKLQSAHMTAGVEKNWFGIGNTTLYGEAGRLKITTSFGDVSGDGWGLGAVQAIDAAAMDLFISYRSIESLDIVHAGARIRF